MIFASIYARSTSERSPTTFENPHSLSYLLASSVRFPTRAVGERATKDATHALWKSYDEFLESNVIHAKSPNRVGCDATNDGPDGTAVDIFKTFEISETASTDRCRAAACWCAPVRTSPWRSSCRRCVGVLICVLPNLPCAAAAAHVQGTPGVLS